MWLAVLGALVVSLGQGGCAPHSVKPDSDEETVEIMEEVVDVGQDYALLREMSAVEASHWVSMTLSIEQRLDHELDWGGITLTQLFGLKRRLNTLIADAFHLYRSFPKDLEYDLRRLTHRIDKAIVEVQEPKVVSIVEVPVYDEEHKPTIRPFQFIWPVSDVAITSPFGRRLDPFTRMPSFHDGIDLAGPSGTLIYAAERGRVIYTGYKGRAGRLVVLVHENGYKSFYCHLKEILTVRGVYVERGQPIGLMGASGRATGPHLHFKITERGKAVNPDRYIGAVLQ